MIVQRSEVVVSWERGLHARPASRLVKLARKFSSSIHLRCNNQIANARSVLHLLLLCATMGTTIQVEVAGEDEEQALQAIQQVFESRDL